MRRRVYVEREEVGRGEEGEAREKRTEEHGDEAASGGDWLIEKAPVVRRGSGGRVRSPSVS